MKIKINNLNATYILLISSLISCSDHYDSTQNMEDNFGSNQNLTQFVNPFIGTKNMGHTFPGAAAPFGMVQLSSETNKQDMYIDGEYNRDAYRYCSGYQYDDSTIFGFSHTHFSGTGHSD